VGGGVKRFLYGGCVNLFESGHGCLLYAFKVFNQTSLKIDF